MSENDTQRLFHLGYVSTETGDLGADGMIELLTEARKANSSRGITGLLLHRERSFYQVLEGTEAEVLARAPLLLRDVFEVFGSSSYHTHMVVKWQSAMVVHAQRLAELFPATPLVVPIKPP